MQTFQFKEIFTDQQRLEFHQWLSQATWYSNVPGGFVTNSPKRLVNAYGDGSPINSEGRHEGIGWESGYWTPKMSQSNISLESPTERLPLPLSTLIPKCRLLFKQVFPDANITDNTFNIAVCNFYNDPDSYIAAHTDANPWYPHESGVGPVFASFTIYPEGEPEENAFARFQIRENDKWIDVKLPHESVLIMPSSIEHRVKPYLKKNRHLFKPRINITLRSTFPISLNPLMNAMATSNHSRYYKLPSRIIHPSDVDIDTVQPILDIYNRFLTNHSAEPLILIVSSPKSVRQQTKKKLVKEYKELCKKNNYYNFKGSGNMVIELFNMIVSRPI